MMHMKVRFVCVLGRQCKGRKKNMKKKRRIRGCYRTRRNLRNKIRRMKSKNGTRRPKKKREKSSKAKKRR
jgi:hypothetical protein